MKIKTLRRSDNGQREAGDVRRQSRNLNPQYHPFARAREYTRAVTAAKMDRMFAKPLIGNLGEGHRDAVYCTATSRKSLVPLVSGAADGTVHLWDLASRTNMASIAAHDRAVSGVCFDETGQTFYSCGEDGIIQQWSIHPVPEDDVEEGWEDSKPSAVSTTSASDKQNSHGPLSTRKCAGSFKSIDHCWGNDQFVTASDSAVQVWSPSRTTALQSHSDLWGSDDTVTSVHCHPVEQHLVANTSADRGIGLHDIRTATALQKTTLRMRSNDLAWNPMEPMNLAVANEDYQAYLFDIRKFDRPMQIFKGHVNAVMSVSWSPTGREFVTGSYDRTVRIFETHGNNRGTSRDIYHTKRMQRVFTVKFTQDSKYIVSGSDDTNLRLWKAQASEEMGQLTARQEAARDYRKALVKKYQHVDGVKRIVKSRKIPKTIRNQTRQTQIIKESQDRKTANRVKYQKDSEFVSEKNKTVVRKID